MAKKSKFSGALSFIGKGIKSGMKVSGFANPTLSVDTVKDHFSLDQKAFDLMGITEGMNVVLIDNHKGEFDPTDPRFYLTVGYEKNGQMEGAKIGKNKSFSYAVIWANMMKNEDGATQVPIAELIQDGMAISRETEKGRESVLSLKKVFYNLEPVGLDDEGNHIEVPVDQDAEGNEILAKVYALVGRVEEAHDPKAPASKTATAE